MARWTSRCQEVGCPTDPVPRMARSAAHSLRAFGFRQVGYLSSVGNKFGHWTDTVMVQRSLGPGGTEPP